MILFGDGLLNVIDGLSIGAAFERNILAGISISVAVMLEEVTHRLGTTAILIRTGFSIKQSFICTFLSACALFPGMIIGIILSDATDEATPYIFCAAGGIFLYTGLVDVMKEMNRSIENAMRKDIRTTLKIFALQNIGIILAVVFLSILALYEPDFEEYQKILNKN
jgi:zinc transporter ZupT